MAKGSKLTLKQRAFVDGVLAGKSALQAYKDAGYSAHSAEANAFRLMDHDGVKAAIDGVRVKSAEKAEITLEWLLQQGKDILVAAMHEGSHSAAVGALKEVGVLSGLRVERSERTNKNMQSLDELSTEDILEFLTQADGGGASSAEAVAKQSDKIH